MTLLFTENLDGKPSRIRILCFREMSRTSRRRASEVVVPVGLHPYWSTNFDIRLSSIRL